MPSFTTDKPGRLDVTLTEFMASSISRSQLQKHIAAGFVRVADKIVTSPNLKLLEGTTIDYFPPEQLPLMAVPSLLNIPIIYQDSDIVVLDKPAGLVTHPQDSHDNTTLVSHLLSIYPAIRDVELYADNPISALRPGIVHRLDKDTSGLLVVALTKAALENLTTQFREHHVEKQYQAILLGKLAAETPISTPIGRIGGGTKNKMKASHALPHARAAYSLFTPLSTIQISENTFLTDTRVTIKTGRTHQIRVHAKALGHPVLGDVLYGSSSNLKLAQQLGATHQQLRAISLSFAHPTTGERLSFSVPPLPFPPQKHARS